MRIPSKSYTWIFLGSRWNSGRGDRIRTCAPDAKLRAALRGCGIPAVGRRPRLWPPNAARFPFSPLRPAVGGSRRFKSCRPRTSKEKTQAPRAWVFSLLVGATGFEPATFASRTQRSSQAELRPVFAVDMAPERREILMKSLSVSISALYFSERGIGGGVYSLGRL